MTDTVQPDWLKNHTPEPHAGNPRWKKGMASPNKAGRPRGIVDRRTKMTQALLDDAQAILKRVVRSALEGDTAAAALALSRVLPTLRAQSERVEFSLDTDAPSSEQAASVLAAIASGLVAPDVGRQIIESIASLYNMRQLDEVSRRLEALESRGRT